MTLKSTFLGAATAALLATSAGAADLTLKFGHVGKPGSLFEASVNAFAECSNKALGSKAEVQTFGSSQLGKDKELGALLYQLHGICGWLVLILVAAHIGAALKHWLVKRDGLMERMSLF